MIWTKGANQSPKFQSFGCSSKISPNLYFDRLLLLKVYKISAKKVQRSHVSWLWRGIQNLKKNWFVVSKLTRIWRVLTWALENLKKLRFDRLLMCKLFNAWPKKVERSYLSWHWRVMQKLKKNWLVVWKMTWGIWQFAPEHWKVSKLGLWCDPWQWRMIQKLKRNWLVVLKLTWGIWPILTRALKSLQNLHFKWAPSDQRI